MRVTNLLEPFTLPDTYQACNIAVQSHLFYMNLKWWLLDAAGAAMATRGRLYQHSSMSVIFFSTGIHITVEDEQCTPRVQGR